MVTTDLRQVVIFPQVPFKITQRASTPGFKSGLCVGGGIIVTRAERKREKNQVPGLQPNVSVKMVKVGTGCFRSGRGLSWFVRLLSRDPPLWENITSVEHNMDNQLKVLLTLLFFARSCCAVQFCFLQWYNCSQACVCMERGIKTVTEPYTGIYSYMGIYETTTTEGKKCSSTLKRISHDKFCSNL